MIALAATGDGFFAPVNLIAQLVAWNAIDPDARSLFTPWVLFVGHLMFGMVAVAWTALGRLQTTVTAASQPRIHVHA